MSKWKEQKACGNNWETPWTDIDSIVASGDDTMASNVEAGCSEARGPTLLGSDVVGSAQETQGLLLSCEPLESMATRVVLFDKELFTMKYRSMLRESVFSVL